MSIQKNPFFGTPLNPGMAGGHKGGCLRLGIQNRIRLLEANTRDRLVIGRHPMCDITIHAQYTSRTHAYLESVEQGFYLTDVSANGTYVLTSNGRSHYLKRERLHLQGTGLISTSKTIEADKRWLIRFECEPASMTFSQATAKNVTGGNGSTYLHKETTAPVLVKFSRLRLVFVDGQCQGVTNKILDVEPGRHVVDLGEPKDYEPANREIEVGQPDEAVPKVVEFSRLR